MSFPTRSSVRLNAPVPSRCNRRIAPCGRGSRQEVENAAALHDLTMEVRNIRGVPSRSSTPSDDRWRGQANSD